MHATPVLGIVFIVALGNSGYFFYLGRELKVLQRIFASLHGLLAVAIMPSVGLVGINPGRSLLIVCVLSVLSVTSITYSMIILRGNRKSHLLHIVTAFVLWLSAVWTLLLFHGS